MNKQDPGISVPVFQMFQTEVEQGRSVDRFSLYANCNGSKLVGRHNLM